MRVPRIFCCAKYKARTSEQTTASKAPQQDSRPAPQASVASLNSAIALPTRPKIDPTSPQSDQLITFMNAIDTGVKEDLKMQKLKSIVIPDHLKTTVKEYAIAHLKHFLSPNVVNKDEGTFIKIEPSSSTIVIEGRGISLHIQKKGDDWVAHSTIKEKRKAIATAALLLRKLDINSVNIDNDLLDYDLLNYVTQHPRANLKVKIKF